MTRLLWMLAVSGAVLTLGLFLLLRRLRHTGLPVPAVVPTSASNGCEAGHREAAEVFAAALLFRLAVFLVMAALVCLMLYRGTGLSWATDTWRK